MLGNFAPCDRITLRYEGGYVDNSRDPGGATNRGITIATLGQWRGHPVTKQDVRNLTKIEASAIYQAHYWDAIRADRLPLGLDLCAYDAAVNSGVGRSKQWLLRVGNLGSVAAIHTFSRARLSFLQGLGTWRVFGRGWGARVGGIETLALRMALGSSPQADSVIHAAAVSAQASARKIQTGAHAIIVAGAGGAAANVAHPTFATLWLVAGLAALVLIAGLIYLRAHHHAARAAALGTV